jgi:hypothetical protein
MHLLGFIIKKLVTMYGHMNVIKLYLRFGLTKLLCEILISLHLWYVLAIRLFSKVRGHLLLLLSNLT